MPVPFPIDEKRSVRLAHRLGKNLTLFFISRLITSEITILCKIGQALLSVRVVQLYSLKFGGGGRI